MARVVLKDGLQEPPKILVEYVLQNDVAVAVVGDGTAFVDDLEDDGVLLVLPDGAKKGVFPEDGEEFLEGLFWEFGGLEGVTAVATDAEGKAIAERYVSKRQELMRSLSGELQEMDREEGCCNRWVNWRIKQGWRRPDAEKEQE